LFFSPFQLAELDKIGDAIHWIWLVDKSDDNNLNELFQNADLPVDSNVWWVDQTENDFLVEEIWKVAANLPLKTAVFAVFDPQMGWIDSSVVKWERRSDLTGLFIRGGSVEVGKRQNVTI